MPANQNSSDAIHVLEALYDLEQPRASWFQSVLKAAASTFDRGAGVGMLLYDVSEDAPRIDAIDGINLGDNSPAFGAALHDNPAWATDITRCYRTAVCATMAEQGFVPADLLAAREQYARLGLADQVLINGSNPSGFGCALYVFSKSPICLTALAREQMARVATHLSAAYRLLRRLETRPTCDLGAVDAVLKADGRLEHAESAASSREARDSLTMAVQRREWARAAPGRSVTERGTAAWRPLVVGRWSLVDRYERNGSRYIVARENEPAPKGPEALSSRERQVAALAAIGHSNKLIAYELGLAHSTVRVLLARAAAKVGARSRADLIEKIAKFP